MQRLVRGIQLTLQERRYLVLPAAIICLVLGSLMVVQAIFPGRLQNNRLGFLSSGAILIVFSALIFYFLLPRVEPQSWPTWVIAGVGGVATGLLFTINPLEIIGIPILLMVVTTLAIVILTGRWQTYLYLALVWLIQQSQMITSSEGGSTGFLRVLILPLLGIALVETVVRLQRIIYKQVMRLQAVNSVARSVASSLEIKQVTSFIGSAIQNALEADTYYFGLVNNNSLLLELFYDDGEFFPPSEIPITNTMAGKVINTQRSLLVNNVPSMSREGKVQTLILGKPKISQSWMGTPLEAGGKVLGVIAVASYQRNAFTQGDLDTIENVANLAAMAIDNARHHEDVETQSHQDSLTGILNHGYFISSLAKEAEQPGHNDPISLIMLDIDYFKRYNDTYGHRIGDQVLIALTQSIRLHIKKTDLLGRWGGEEFIIALPGANGSQALIVAMRIQETLNEIELKGRQGETIPVPTVSMGIAVFPTEAQDIYELIDRADSRLYLAKERGRNQIEPDLNLWDSSSQ